MMPLDTLDALGSILFTLEAEDLPEPSELAEALGHLRLPDVVITQPALIMEVAEVIERAGRCWQHGFIVGAVAYGEACEEPRWPSGPTVARWLERDERSYSADLFMQRWYRAGWLAGWDER
jgi:hypothetical protein